MHAHHDPWWRRSVAVGAVMKPALKPEEREIRRAVEFGVRQYWDDVAFSRWRDGGFVGDGPQISKGSIVDYVVRALLANDE